MKSGAIFDETGIYRYSLWRIWNESMPRVTFIMLNPSTADDKNDDPTVRKCIRFARKWGYGSLEVVNLFAFKATNLKELRRARDSIGPDNDSYILEAVQRSNLVVAAWGNKGKLFNRNRAVRMLLASYKIHCLGITRAKEPRNPLYVKEDTELIDYPLF